MTDITSTLSVPVAGERHDGTILSIAGVGLLMLLLLVVALLPFDGAPDPASIPTYFGP